MFVNMVCLKMPPYCNFFCSFPLHKETCFGGQILHIFLTSNGKGSKNITRQIAICKNQIIHQKEGTVCNIHEVAKLM